MKSIDGGGYAVAKSSGNTLSPSPPVRRCGLGLSRHIRSRLPATDCYLAVHRNRFAVQLPVACSRKTVAKNSIGMSRFPKLAIAEYTKPSD